MPQSFFSSPLPHGLDKQALARYRQSIEESMSWLNQTCRYRVASENHFKMPPLFITDDQKNVEIPGGVAITDALDSIFSPHHDKTPSTERWIIDCLLANLLVSAQAARKVFGDDAFNQYADAHRKGRDRPIKMKHHTHPFLLDLGLPSEEKEPVKKTDAEVIFAYISQEDIKMYSRKHMHLSSIGFHHIQLPDGHCFVFAPDQRGQFNSQKALAEHLIQEMNADLTSEEWCAWIVTLKKKLLNHRKANVDAAVEKLSNHAKTDLSSFLALLSELGSLYSAYFKLENTKEREDLLNQLQQRGLINPIDAENESLCFCIVYILFQLNTHILPLNQFKIPPEHQDKTIEQMLDKAARCASFFHAARFETWLKKEHAQEPTASAAGPST